MFNQRIFILNANKIKFNNINWKLLMKYLF